MNNFKNNVNTSHEETAWERYLRNAEYISTAAQQGLSLGWADEAEGVMGGLGYALASLNPRWNQRDESIVEAALHGYALHRDMRCRNLEEGYKNAPVLTTLAETAGALASPVKVFNVAKNAPLSLQNANRWYNAVSDAIIYGIGSSNNINDYAQNIALGGIGNALGTWGSNKVLGRGENMFGKGVNSIVRNTTNQFLTSIGNSVYSVLDDQHKK